MVYRTDTANEQLDATQTQRQMPGTYRIYFEDGEHKPILVTSRSGLLMLMAAGLIFWCRMARSFKTTASVGYEEVIHFLNETDSSWMST